MQVTKSKHKLAWLKPILLTLAFIFMFGLALNVTPSIEAQAGYDFDEGDPTAKGSKELIGGPTWAHTGTVFYLVDEHGESIDRLLSVYPI